MWTSARCPRTTATGSRRSAWTPKATSRAWTKPPRRAVRPASRRTLRSTTASTWTNARRMRTSAKKARLASTSPAAIPACRAPVQRVSLPPRRRERPRKRPFPRLVLRRRLRRKWPRSSRTLRMKSARSGRRSPRRPPACPSPRPISPPRRSGPRAPVRASGGTSRSGANASVRSSIL